MHPSPTLRQTRAQVRERLLAVGISEAALESILLVEAATGLDRLHQMTSPERPISSEEGLRLESLVEQRLSRKPLSQVLGQCIFFGLRLRVDEAVLCPRPETELLVELTLAHLANGPQGQWVADLGTGSGAIALALAAQGPDLHVVAIDSSEAALSVARRNGTQTGLSVDWRLSDWTSALTEDEVGRFAAIVSNPPYISEADWQALEPEVRDYEPKGALVGGTDGLDPYRILPSLVWPYLQPGGLFAVELGIGQAEAVEALFRQAGYEQVASSADYAGIARFVHGKKPALSV